MKNLNVNFDRINGNIKRINAVNNGPAGTRTTMAGNFKNYDELDIPYARLHDSAFYAGNYGGEFAVDVHRIFPDFDADVDDPASYLFSPTDSYLEDILTVGTKIYYRLGASIEHGYKKGTIPPKDYLKWAKICEHIIRHYTEGWADGFNHDIEYWEIWNEFDCKNPDGSNPCWQGTDEEFFDFFNVVFNHLKSSFPSLKIGGPAICSPESGSTNAFLDYVVKNDIKLDFFSYHWYGATMEALTNRIISVNKNLKAHGLENLETHLNEWNYVRAWTGEDYKYSMNTLKNHKGASFIAAVMCTAQKEKLDMIMYYDARPTAWNGIFGSYGAVFKPFYVYKAAKDIVALKNSADIDYDDNIYAIASSSGDESALLFTFYNEDDNAPTEKLKINFSGAKKGEILKAEFYLINKENNLELVKSEYFTSEKSAVILSVNNYDVYLVKFKNEI